MKSVIEPVVVSIYPVHYWPMDEVLKCQSPDDDIHLASKDFSDGVLDDDEVYDLWDNGPDDILQKVLQLKRLDRSYQRVKAAMQTSGVCSPIGIAYGNEGGRYDGYYIANGHHRLAAMLDLAYPIVPCVLCPNSAEQEGHADMVRNPWMVSEDWMQTPDCLSYGPLIPPPGSEFDKWYRAVVGSQSTQLRLGV